VLGAVPPGSVFRVDVQLQDSNADLTTSQTVTVSVPVPGTSPEPTSLLLLATGFTGMWVMQRKRLVHDN